jgi:hypothetical protein
MTYILSNYFDEFLTGSVFKFKTKMHSVQITVRILNAEINQNNNEETSKC